MRKVVEKLINQWSVFPLKELAYWNKDEGEGWVFHFSPTQGKETSSGIELWALGDGLLCT